MKRLCFAAFAVICTSIVPGAAPADAMVKPQRASSSKSASLADKIAHSAQSVATRMDSVGFCYRGVKRALNSTGVTLSGSAAWMAKAQLQKDSRFKMVPIKDLKKGDIIVRGRSSAHPHGHIAVYLGNNEEASDHVQRLVPGGRYGTSVVFRARDNDRAASAQVDDASRSNTVYAALKSLQGQKSRSGQPLLARQSD